MPSAGDSWRIARADSPSRPGYVVHVRNLRHLAMVVGSSRSSPVILHWYRCSSAKSCGSVTASVQRRDLHFVPSVSVEIAFDSPELRMVCESDRHARAELGDESAEALQALIADLMVAQSLADLPTGRLQGGFQQPDGRYALSMGKDGHIIVERNHVRGRWTGRPPEDLPRISRIKVLRIDGFDG